MAEYITEHWNTVLRKVREVTETDSPITQKDPVIPKDQEQGGANETEKLVVIVILCIFSVIGTLGNGLVLYVFTRSTAKMASTIFILALAGTDFVTCLVIIPYTVTAIQLDYYLAFDILCKTYQFLITCTVPLSAFIMVAIAVDRYICICHPFAHVMTVRRAKIIVGILAIFATILGLITALGFSVYHMDKKVNATENISEVQVARNNNSSNITTKGTGTFQTDFTADTYHIREDEITEEHKVYKAVCNLSTVLLSAGFISVYQKIYSAFYLCSLLIVLILYGLIYSSVTKQRAKRRAQKMAGRVKQVNTHCQTDESTIPLTNIKAKSKVNSNHNNITLKVEMDGETATTRLMADEQPNGIKEAESRPMNKTSIRKVPTSDSNKDRKDHDRLANIKTAVMLFIVTVVFIVAFLPAWLMAHRWITFNTVVFYMYFVYNVANPVIYAFMNQMFRENMCRIFNSCRIYVNRR